MNEEYYGNNYNNNQGNQYPQGNGEYEQQGCGYPPQQGYGQQYYGEPENQDYGYPNQQGYNQQYYDGPENQSCSYPNQQGYQDRQDYDYPATPYQPAPDDKGKADDGKFKKKWIIIIACIILVVAAVTVSLVIYFNRKTTAQDAYRDLLTDISDDPKAFFADISSLDGYDISGINITDDEFSITDTDGDSVPELIINITSTGKGNSFALVYDYNDDDGAQLRGVMKPDPEFYSGGTVVTKSDEDGEITLIEKYDTETREYAPLVRYYESDVADEYIAEKYDNDSWGDAEEYTYSDLMNYITETFLKGLEKLIINFEKITKANISAISDKDSVTPERESVTEVSTEEKTVEPDFEMLEKVFYGMEYDCNSPEAGDKALWIVLTGEFGTAHYYLDESDYTTVSKDDVPGEVQNAEYTKYSAEDIDNIIRKAYNTEPPAHREEYDFKIDNEPYVYYFDGYYYSRIVGIDGTGWYEIDDYTVDSDGIYTVTWEQWYDVGEKSDIIVTTKVKPVEINGKSNWSFYSVTKKNAEETTTETTTESEPENIFETIAGDYVYSTGMGAWATELTIYSDGTFEGFYHDSNDYESGDGYEGTSYGCSFTGKFSTPVKVSDNKYSMKIEKLVYDGEVGEETIEDGRRSVTSEAYGLTGDGKFYVYLPGYDTSNITETVSGLFYLNKMDNRVLKDGEYVIENISEKEVFIPGRGY